MTKDDNTNQPGPWAIMITMMEQSPPTKLDARIFIREPEKEPGLNPPPAAPPNGLLASLLTPSSSSSPRQNPPIEFRLKTSFSELIPVKAGGKPDYNQRVRTLFTESAHGTSLQYP